MFAKSVQSTLVLISAIGLSGCIEEQTKTYPYSSQQAMSMLGGGSMPGVVGIKSRAEQIPKGGLRWNGRKGRKCEAVIKAVGDNQVEITPTCSIGSQEPASELKEKEIELASFAFAEYVDSTMTGRPLDQNKINSKAVATLMQSTGAIADEMDRYAAESDARAAAYKRDRAANEAAASFGKPTAMGDSTFGQPTAQTGN